MYNKWWGNQFFLPLHRPTSDKAPCVVDGDVSPGLEEENDGPKRILSTPVDDLESFIYLNRHVLLSDVELPIHQESSKVKQASKPYWKWLTNNKGFSAEQLYRIIVDAEDVDVAPLAEEIRGFLGR